MSRGGMGGPFASSNKAARDQPCQVNFGPWKSRQGHRDRSGFRLGLCHGGVVLLSSQGLSMDGRPNSRGCRSLTAGEKGGEPGLGRRDCAFPRRTSAGLRGARPRRRHRLHRSGPRTRPQPGVRVRCRQLAKIILANRRLRSRTRHIPSVCAGSTR
jgi:hypothetical protein